MRRHATAHLSKIERELRPTVIVTNSDTVLLGNQEKDSRRIKRVPKKFDDYENSVTKKSGQSDSERDEPPNKKAKTKSDDFKPRSRQIESSSPEELFSIKTEVKKMLHVSVDVIRFEHLEEIEPWCMMHKHYKCYCKGIVSRENSPEVVKKVEIKSKEPPKNNTMPKKIPPPSPATPDEEAEDGFSQRVLPVLIDTDKPKPVQNPTSNIAEVLPRIEIVNLCDLINGKIGPIIFNIYDDKTIRLNPVLRNMLNNKCAIIYFDGFAYFVDKTRVNINKLDFSQMESELEHPIFIIQPKNAISVPVSSTSADDFINFLFHKKSDLFVQITEKSILKTISELIESMLCSVRKKIEVQLGSEEKTMLVKEQLSMITNNRSRSTSRSSASSSPLSFNGYRLTEAPAPGFNTPKMQEFNKIFSMRMQRIVSLIAANTLGLKPSNEMLNKFYFYRWNLLLQSFEEDLVQIWQVRLEGESGTEYQMLVLSDSREIPEVEFAKKENTVNIRKLKISDNIAELARMILLRVENAAMTNMMILFYGCKGYMRICGILNSKGCIQKPNRSAHPVLAAKIQKAYNLWHESMVKEEIKRFQKKDDERRENRLLRLEELKKQQQYENQTKKVRRLVFQFLS